MFDRAWGAIRSIPRRCPVCRTRRKDPLLMLRHLQESGHRSCGCGGYHYAHRPGSKCCDSNPMCGVNQAVRRGEDPAVIEDIALDIALDFLERTPSRHCERPNRRKPSRTSRSTPAACPF